MADDRKLRTIHSSYVDLDPTEYEYVGSMDTGDDSPGQFMGVPTPYTMDDGTVVVANNAFHAEYLWLSGMLHASFNAGRSLYDESGQCDHCGAHLRYVVVMRHKPTGSAMVIGETCHAERFSHDSKVAKDLDRLHKQAAAMRALAKVRAEVDTWLAADPLNSVAVEYAEAHREGNMFYTSLLGKLREYGPWSLRQRDAVLSGPAREAERAAREAARAAEVKVPVVTGKVAVTGAVVKTDWQENEYGGHPVMTVRDDRGFLVWGTVPSALVGVQVGERVSFSANVTAGDRDESFGFFKRPTKAQRLEGS